MTVSIDDPEEQKWIKMELIKAADMEKGTVSESGFTAYTGSGTGDHLATGTPWTAGNGKRAFFTTSLFKDGTPLKNKVEVTTTRDRVYFYIDENLSDSEDRTATVTLTYYEGYSDIPVETRELDITQVHLLKVQVYKTHKTMYRDENGTLHDEQGQNRVPVPVREDPYAEYEEDGALGGVIYMEQFEEYLDHYDPLDNYNTEQIYPGLKWATSNTPVDVEYRDFCQLDYWNYHNSNQIYAGAYINNCYDNYIDGHSYTGYIINQTGEGIITLNDEILSAFQYCHNKNKRNSDGEVPYSVERHRSEDIVFPYQTIIYKGKWFLPGITQMEDALTTYYNMFPEFQGNYYWSSSAAKQSYLAIFYEEDSDRARATKIDSQGFYVESDQKTDNYYPNGGNAPRSQVLRIRAFRIDLKPYDY